MKRSQVIVNEGIYCKTPSVRGMWVSGGVASTQCVVCVRVCRHTDRSRRAPEAGAAAAAACARAAPASSCTNRI